MWWVASLHLGRLLAFCLPFHCVDCCRPCCFCCCLLPCSGNSPTFARSLPNRICTATGGNPAAGGSRTTPSSLRPVLPRTPVAASEQIPAGIARIEAANAAAGVFNTAGLPASQQVAVGVVDSGVDGTHPDLNLVGGKSWVTPSAQVAGDVANPAVDRYGHGTHVAGILGARNNGECPLPGLIGLQAAFAAMLRCAVWLPCNTQLYNDLKDSDAGCCLYAAAVC
eukprot:GHRQ01024327.1.p2 GENE.GHRQ01024327.1~~GHRQ01024327.1.p2  ORF type:complete len:224 (+),score=43.68 GHRQ01024327.1:494-1165(+)